MAYQKHIVGVIRKIPGHKEEYLYKRRLLIFHRDEGSVVENLNNKKLDNVYSFYGNYKCPPPAQLTRRRDQQAPGGLPAKEPRTILLRWGMHHTSTALYFYRASKKKSGAVAYSTS